MTPKAVVLLSGGMDSATLAYLVENNGYDVYPLSVDYGQRHKIELTYARMIANKLRNPGLQIPHKVLDFTAVRTLLEKNVLTGSGPVPTGHYTQENMAQTVVPNRNAILLAIAFGYAVTVGASQVCTAVHAGDHAIYPDCRPEFIGSFEAMEKVSITHDVYGVTTPKLYAPFLLMSKAEIVKIGDGLNVPYGSTWSCYNGDPDIGHCGRCGTCVERIGAFNAAGVIDPTKYYDRDFAEATLRQHGEWKENNQVL